MKLNNIDIVIANTFFKRLIGLMFRKNISFGMLFLKCNSIHTFFMFAKIDVIGLDKKNTVIFIKRNVRPFALVSIKSNIKKTSILELPNNTSLNINFGDILCFEDKDIV